MKSELKPYFEKLQMIEDLEKKIFTFKAALNQEERLLLKQALVVSRELFLMAYPEFRKDEEDE